MIKTLLIKNFQSHKRTELNFSEGVNVITGQSDCGKTAIIRALRWLIYNRPSGDAFRSNWGGDTTVETHTDDAIVKRIKTKANNEYVLGDAHFKAFGTGVPPEVQSALRFNETNMQQQLDAPFLLSASAGEVAAHFNRIANIDVIDRSIKKAKQERSRTKQSIEQRKGDLTEKLEQYKQYSNLEQAEADLKILEGRSATRVLNKASLAKITVAIARTKAIDVKLAGMQKLLRLQPMVEQLIVKIKERDVKFNNLKRLRGLINTVNTIDKQLEENKGIVVAESVVSTLIQKIVRVKQSKHSLSTLNALISKYTTVNTKLLKSTKELVTLQNSLPTVCPVCNGTGKLKN